MTTELLRDTLDLLPQSVIRLWRQQEEKLLQRAKTEQGNVRETSEWLEVKQEVKTWILEQHQTDISFDQEEVKGLHKIKTLIISQGHLYGALSL